MTVNELSEREENIEYVKISQRIVGIDFDCVNVELMWKQDSRYY